MKRNDWRNRLKSVLTGLMLWLVTGLQAQQFYERSAVYGDVEMHFDLDSVGPKGSRGVVLRIPGELNGRRQTFTLDTGASINVVSPQLADALGLISTDTTADVEGIGLGTGRMVVADTLHLGNVTFAHVPFYIMEATTGDSLADVHLRHLRLMLGRPLLEALGRVTVDFDQHLLTAPKRPKRKQKRVKHSNLEIADNVLMLTLGDGLRVIPDFGATHSVLDSAYFAAHRDEITARAKADTVRYAGFGGMTTGVEYTLKDFAMTIDGKPFVLPAVTVYTTDGYEPRLGMDFFSHQRRVVIDLRRWRMSVEKLENEGGKTMVNFG